jgi:hypothetical protein
MDIIKREIDIENAKGKPDKFYLAKLRTMLDKTNPITFNDFIDTGRITPKEVVMKEDPTALFREDTRDVVSYIGQNYIEIQSDGKFYTQFNVEGTLVRYGSTQLFEAEKVLWESYIKPTFYGQQAED